MESLTLEKNTGYRDVIVSNRAGDFVLGTDEHRLNAPVLREAIERAFATGKMQNTGFYRDDYAGEKHLHFDFVATLVEIPEFVLVMQLDKDRFLFPFLQN